MRVCVTTYADTAFEKMRSLCAKTLRKYSESHNLDIRVYGDVDSGRPPAWNKILVVRRLLQQEYDFVFWIDSDAIFVRFDKDIREETRSGKDLYLVKHHIGGRDVPNTGVLLIRNSRWSQGLLDRLWAMAQYTNHKWWENAALLDILGYRNLLDSRQPNECDRRLLGRIEWLDLKWNSLPNLNESPEPIIKHYAGVPHQQRAEEMTLDLIRIGLI